MGHGDGDRRGKRPRDRPLGLRGDERVRAGARGRGRAALSVHQPPMQLARWHGTEVVAGARDVLERAVADPAAVVLVRGAAHRRIFETAFSLPEGRLRILPASFPLPLFRPARRLDEILALTRHSPEKAAIPRLAVEMTKEGLDRGRDCRLTVAGEGPTRERVEALCADRLPSGHLAVRGRPGGRDRQARRRRRRRRPGLDDPRGGGAGASRRRRPLGRQGAAPPGSSFGRRATRRRPGTRSGPRS